MIEEYSGYDEYSNKVQKIRTLIEENSPGVASESQDITNSCKHYTLGVGLHVYVQGDNTYISDESIGIFSEEKEGEQSRQLYMKVNENEVSLTYHPGNGKIHTVLRYGNRKLKEKDEKAESLSDYAFFPRSFNGDEFIKSVRMQIGNSKADLKAIPLYFSPEDAMPDVKIIWDRMFLLHEAMESVLEKAELEEIRGQVVAAEIGTTLVELAGTLKIKAKRVTDLEESIAKGKQNIQKHKGEEEILK